MDGQNIFFDIYASILKMNGAYEKESKGVKLTYDFLSPELNELRKKYSLDKVAGSGYDFEKSCNLLFWLTENIVHLPSYDNHISSNSLSLLQYSFKKGDKKGINCRALSVILTECLLSVGVYARTVYLMPFAPYDVDNHVVTHAYIRETGNWVMFDPTFNCYVLDENQNPLDLMQIRDLSANRRPLFFNKEISYNGKKTLEYLKGTKAVEAYYSEYISKNLFYFQTCLKSCFNGDDDNGNKVATLLPLGYDLKKSKLSNIEYMIGEYKKEGIEESIIGRLKDYYNRIQTRKVRNLKISAAQLIAVRFN